MKKITIIFGFVLFLLPLVSLAEHKSAVAGKIINSDDSGITPAHGEVCAVVHYHGTLDEVTDPAPNGCGHGEVTLIAHGDSDGETLPVATPTETTGLWTRFTNWVKSITSEDVGNVVDVAAEANGLPPPNTISDAVDITKEATPSIMENVENIENYRESIDPEDDNLDLYRNPADGLEEGSVSQRFFKWFSSLTD